VQGEDVGTPAIEIWGLGEVFCGLDSGLELIGKVMIALGLGEPWQTRSRMDEIRQNLVGNLHGNIFEMAEWG
jgi:hypothetical protein